MLNKSRPDVSTEKIAAMYAAGKDQYQIARELGISQASVSYRMRTLNIPRRTRWERYASASKEHALALYNGGMSGYSVAKQLGVTPAAVYAILRNAGVTIREVAVYPTRRGENNPAWSGGRHISRGYVVVYHDHPSRRQKRRYALEHRVVMERLIGRPLTRDEIVHHMNGIRTDNRPENLALTTRKDHEHYTYVKCLQARIRQLESLIQKKNAT